MEKWISAGLISAMAALAGLAASVQAAETGAQKNGLLARNVVIFVADGMRYDSVNESNGPTFMKVRREGVDFTNSHAVYPTLTTVNGAAIATGHLPGDNGDYANTMYTGFPSACQAGATVTFIEDNCVLREIKTRYQGGYLGQTTLMQAAQKAGVTTIIVGKNGPAGIQNLNALESKDDSVSGFFMDEFTNKLDTSPTLNEPLASEIQSATGAASPAYTTAPNWVQQSYFLAATTQVLIPHLRSENKPFALLFWSRDPDTTQHAATDSAGRLVPGINSNTDWQAIHNADNDLKGILDTLKQYGLDKTTDVIVIADHGFSTIAKGIPDSSGNYQTTLQNGWLAKDIAGWMGEKVYTPNNKSVEVDVAGGEHPGDSSYIGKSGQHPDVITVSNGNTEFIYVTGDGAAQQAKTKMLVEKLLNASYTGGLFVNDAVMKGHEADFKGTLPMSDIGMIGVSTMPQPTIVITFRSFLTKGCQETKPLLCAAEVADTTLDVGQGNHGALSRADTRNYMAAIGPDFKAGVKISSPVGNVDVAPTAAHILGVSLSGAGTLKGRVMTEAFKGAPEVRVTTRRIVSEKSDNGLQTVLDTQEVGGVRYMDAGGIPGRVVGLE